MTLHIVSKSPFSSSALADCLGASGDQDTILLIEDGVYAALPTHQYAGEMRKHKVYCLGADAQARGVAVDAPVTVIDEARWVALCTEHTPIVSWFK